jgi:teichuronic acid biosynthesis glycosyltransferase TuaC
VLAVIPGEGRGASFIFARRQVKSLQQAGLSVRVLYFPNRSSLLALFAAWRHLRKVIGRYAPDIVHAHYGTITSFVCACGTRKPLVITFRGSDLNPDSAVGFLRSRLGFFLSQLSTFGAAGVICTSSELRERLWWAKKKASIVPSGVDLSLFEPRDRLHSRQILGWKTDERIVILNVGRAPSLKGAPLARRAVALAEKEIGPIRLIELDGSMPHQNIPICLNAADCLLLTSTSEGSPNILKEALACNLPITSVDVGDSALRLRGVSPSKVVERNAASLAGALCEILTAPQRSNGRQSILNCSEDRIACVLSDIYHDVWDRSRVAKKHREATAWRDV